MRFIAVLALVIAVTVAAPGVDLADEMTQAAAASTTKGLAVLAAKQQPDGSWRADGNEVGVTASCALAFMAHGHVPGLGRYGANTSRALQFLLKNAQGDGLICGKSTGSPMYNHGLAALALAEAWGQTGDKRLREALRRAVDLICATQNNRGGWRYQPKVSPDDDISVTVMQLMALRAAKDAGMAVPKEVIDAGIAYVKSCHNSKGAGKDGGFRYGPIHTESGWARTGAGITSLQVAGNYRASEVSEGVEYLMTWQPPGQKSLESEKEPYYGAYYVTMGMYQAQSLGAYGKKAWGLFYPAMTKWIMQRQAADGTWPGTAYPSAMSLLVLAIPCRYLPIYQR
jgi:hypothetical protein